MALKREKVIKAAEKYVARGKLEAAIKEYRKVLAEDANDTNTLNRVGDLYARLERYDEAVKLFSQIADKYTRDGFFVKAIAIYKKIIKLDPTVLRVYERLAELYHRQGLITEARSQYQVLADYYQKHENATSAITIYQRMSEMEPDNPSFHLKLAELYASQRLTDKAQREFRALGDLLVDNDSADEAVQAYMRGIELAPQNLDNIRQSVGHLNVRGAVSAAANLLNKVTELNPEAEAIAAQLGLTTPEPEPEPEVQPEPQAAAQGVPGDGFHPVSQAPDVDDTGFGAPFEDPTQPSGPPAVAGEGVFASPAAESEPTKAPTFEAPTFDSPASFDEPEATFDAGPTFDSPASFDSSFQGDSFGESTTVVEPSSGFGTDTDEFTFDLDEEVDLSTEVQPPAEAAAVPTATSVDGDEVPVGQIPSFDLDDESMPSTQVVPPDDLTDTAGQAFKIDLDELKGAQGDPELSEMDFAPQEPGYEPAESVNFDQPAAPQPAAPQPAAPQPAAPQPAAPQPAAPQPDFEPAPTFEPTPDFGVSPDPPVVEPPALEASPEIEIEWPTDAMDDLDVTLPAMELEGDEADDADETMISTRQPAVPQPAVPQPVPEAAPAAQPFSLSIDLDDEEEEEDDLDATRPARAVAHTPEPKVEIPAAPAVRRDEDLVAEAAVFAKYGLIEKAVDRLDDLLRGNPDHLEGLALRAKLDLEAGRAEDALARANDLKDRSEAQGDLSHWESLRDELAAAGHSLDPQEVVVAEAAEPPEDDRIAQLLEDLSLDSFDTPAAREPSVVDNLLAQEEPIAAEVTHADSPEPTGGSKFSLADELTFDDLDDEVPQETSGALPPPAEDLMDETGMSWLDEPTPAPDQAKQIVDTSTMFDEEDDFFDLAAELEEELGEEAASIDESMLTTVESQEQSLEEVIEGFKQGVAENLSPEDYDTHFNLGIAYREMGLMDEAIGEFQLASKDPRYLVECASMLGICFQEKGLPELAVRWYQKGLASPDINEDATLGLLYDMGVAYESQGDATAAYKTFVEIYGMNTNFRDVSSRLQDLAPQ